MGTPGGWFGSARRAAGLEKRRDFWRKRAGEDAERWNWKAMRTQIVFAGVQALFCLLVVVAVVIPAPGLEPVVIGVELFAGAVLVVRLVFRHMFYREAGMYFGVKVRWYRPVPIRDDKFAAWCTRHGVQNSSPRT